MKANLHAFVWLLGAAALATSCQNSLVPDDQSSQEPEAPATELRATTASDLKGKILLDELLFNISNPFVPEEYVTITNVSRETIYLPGQLSIGITTDFTTAPRIGKYQSLKYVYASQVYTFPNKGKRELNPGETIKVARAAHNFEEWEGRFDNEDAKFEVFIQPSDGSPSVADNNKDVPNMDYFSHFQAWHTQLDGSAGIFLIQYNRDGSAREGDIQTYIKRRIERGLPHPKAPNEPRLYLTGVKIPASWIIDAFQAQPRNGAPSVHSVFPTTVVKNGIRFNMPLKYDPYNSADLCKGIRVKRIGHGSRLQNTGNPKNDFKVLY